MSDATAAVTKTKPPAPPPGRVRRGFIYVHVDEDVRVDLDGVLEEIPDEQLYAEVERRRGCVTRNGPSLLLSVFEEFQRRGDAPQCLKDLCYEQLGRVL
jgi:hypothetical protein